ncbi:hypothetical protein FRB94_014615 [Tulasnella sp. JGI-2019a]|nr:hypothetical protein FRB93_002817 [Tulasnella sp. JGI-2019a]KAG9007142.1 hypothetical protein FRB94_014615 [Tulasnella sp. JGI-2019a]
MVLGITFRRRKTIDEPQEPEIKPSPSLPALSPTGLSRADWPAGLITNNNTEGIDESSTIGKEGEKANASHQLLPPFGGPSKTVTSFHRPFKTLPGNDVPANGTADEGKLPRTSIASMYTSPPSSFPRSNSVPAAVHSPPSQAGNNRRVVRVPPRFNIMVAGGVGSGKTSFLKLFLNTCDVSPTASGSETANMKQFLEAPTRRTKSLKTVSIEVCEDRHDRVQLTLIDTVGFDFDQGRELEMQLGVSSVIKYLDQQFAESMLEESKVVRKNKGDQHVHLCLYLINPSTIMRPSTRREKSTLRALSKPLKHESPSATPSEETSDTSTSDEEENVYGQPSDADDDNEGEGEKTSTELGRPEHGDGGQRMCPAELKVMQRLANRCNVLPVIAHADTLTEERLALVRRVVRREVEEAGIGFGIFDNDIMDGSGSVKKLRHGRRGSGSNATNGTPPPLPPLPPTVTSNAHANAGVTSGEDTDEERPSRPVIKLRSARTGGRTQERSRSRRRMLAVEEDVLVERADGQDASEGSSSWPALSKADLATMLPLTIISPEESPRAHKPYKRRREKSDIAAQDEQAGGTTNTTQVSETSAASDTTAASPNLNSTEPLPLTNGDNATAAELTKSPKADSVASTRTSAIRRRPSIKEYKAHIRSPRELRGKFIRKYRWGTIDALDPTHCDFVALRTAVLGTHMRMLRNTTKEVLYENFRTEKLLARRATQSFNDAEREKMLRAL